MLKRPAELLDLPDRARVAERLPGYGCIVTRAPGGRVVVETPAAGYLGRAARGGLAGDARSPRGVHPMTDALPVWRRPFLRLRFPAPRDASGHVLLGLLAEDRDLLRRRAASRRACPMRPGVRDQSRRQTGPNDPAPWPL